MRLLDLARDRVAATAMALARRAATDVGWRRMCHAIGAPNMLAGFLRLRDLGVAPQAIIDGGACMGSWTTLCKNVYPNASILMIEPQGLHRTTLERVCERYGPTVRFAETLLGPYSAPAVPFVVMDDGIGGTGSSVMSENSNVPRHVVQLPMMTLDDLVEKTGFPAPTFIKLDVQGYELEVLKGSTKTLADAEFVLLEVSISQYNEGSPLIDEVLAWMRNSGFVTYEIWDLSRHLDGTLVQVDILFIRDNSHLIRDRVILFPA